MTKFLMEDIIKMVREELKGNADEKTRISGERYFKEEVRIYSLRDAIEKMPVDLKKEAMAK